MGLGAMGQRHARVLESLRDRFDVIGAYDTRSDAPVPPGLSRLSGEADAIARADVVVVATPAEAHAGFVTRALAAGRHVLVEKPLCPTAAEAQGVAGAARGGARLYVGHSERFNPVVRTLARLVRANEVVAIDLRRVGPSRPSACGVLVNLGVHDFDLAAYLAGGDLVLRGAVAGRGSPGAAGPHAGRGEDLAHVLFSTGSGAVGHLYVDRTFASKQRDITLATSRWIYRGDLLGHRLVRNARNGGAQSDVPLPLEEPLVAQAKALADSLDGGASRELATGADGARAVVMAEAAASCLAPPEELSLHMRP